MNKRQLANVIRMFHNGLSPELCVSVIIDIMSINPAYETSKVIHEFYQSIYNLSVKQLED